MTTTTTTTTKTPSSTTMKVIQRGTFSTASSVLLLCAALLLTKSCTVLALSGDGNAELAAQADAWGEATTVGEGSGWQTTIISTEQPDQTTEQNELTTDAIEDVDTTTINAKLPTVGGEETTAAAEAEPTVSPNEPEQETTVQPIEKQPTSGPNEEQSPSSPNGQQSTSSPSELPSSTGPSAEQSSSSPGEQPSTSGPNQEQPTTSGTNQEQSSSGPSAQQSTTTEAEPIINTIAPTAPAPPAPLVFECQTVGLFPHISGDCQRFHNCLLDPLTAELRAFEMQCPPTTVFSPSFGRCVRDLAECANDAFVCPGYGRYAGSDDTYYYNCVPSVRGGFHKYIVRCSVGQRFEPLFGRCWRFDWTQVLPGQALEASDLAAIKREQKELKAEEKLRKKAEKNLEKAARKQQKLEEKLAKKAAKEQAKKEAEANKPLSVESAESLEQSSNGN